MQDALDTTNRSFEDGAPITQTVLRRVRVTLRALDQLEGLLWPPWLLPLLQVPDEGQNTAWPEDTSELSHLIGSDSVGQLSSRRNATGAHCMT